MRPPRHPASVERIEQLVATAFADAQRTLAAHPRAFKLLLSAHAASPSVFLSAFTLAVNRVVLIFARQPAVERLVTFISTFAATNISVTGDFCTCILAYLLEQTNASNQAVRFRCVQLIAAVLHALPEDAEVADEVWDPLQAVALSRASDRVPRVRAAAAAALCRLQTTGDPDDDQFASRLVDMIRKDSSAAVRKAALQAIAITEATLPAVVGRTRDIRPDVRRIAIDILARKVDPSGLLVEERVALLKAGLRDRDSSVRKACTESLLLEGWLDGACEGNVFDLVELLGCNAYEEDVLLALRCVFSSKSHSDLVERIEIDVNNLVHSDVLVLRALADTQKGESFMDKFIPSTLAYSQVLLYYAVDDFASRHLLDLSKKVDMSDEAGRKGLETVIRNDFLASRQISEETASYAIRAMQRAMLDEEATVRLMLEIVRVDILGDISEDDESLSSADSSAEERNWRQIRALNVCKEILRSGSQAAGTASVINSLCKSLVEVAVLPQLLCTNAEKRRSAMECVGLFCLLDGSSAEARRHLPIFIQASKTDVPEIQELALQVIVDCMMVFDFADYEEARSISSPRSQNEVDNDQVQDGDGREESLSAIAEECVNVLSQNITHLDGTLRAVSVQGLARLLFVRRISPSPTLLSRLLIAHHNPSTEDDDQLRQCLSVFFPTFAQFSSENRLGLEESFKQTCDLLFAAPSKSSLSTISVVKVAQFVLHLTNPANAGKSPRNISADVIGRSAEQIHERIAEVVLNQIIDAIDGDEVYVYREYARVLSSFRFSCNNSNVEKIRTLQKLARCAMEESDNRWLVSHLRRFRDRLTELLDKTEIEIPVAEVRAEGGAVEEGNREVDAVEAEKGHKNDRLGASHEVEAAHIIERSSLSGRVVFEEIGERDVGTSEEKKRTPAVEDEAESSDEFEDALSSPVQVSESSAATRPLNGDEYDDEEDNDDDTDFSPEGGMFAGKQVAAGRNRAYPRRSRSRNDSSAASNST